MGGVSWAAGPSVGADGALHLQWLLHSTLARHLDTLPDSSRRRVDVPPLLPPLSPPKQLGLYAELYAYAKGLKEEGLEEDKDDFFTNVLRMCQQSRDDIFPSTFRPAAEKRVKNKSFRRASLMDTPGPSDLELSTAASFKQGESSMKRRETVAEKGAADSTLVKPKAVGSGGEFELFGMLVEQTEAMIDEDEELRKQLASSVDARRVHLHEKRSALTDKAKRAVTSAKNVERGSMQFHRLLGKDHAKDPAPVSATRDDWAPAVVQV